MNKLLILLQIILVAFGTVGNAIPYHGSNNVGLFNANYDIELEHPIYAIERTDKILYKDELNIIFESIKDMDVGNVVSTDDFLGKIISKNGNQFTASPYDLSNVIEKGKLHIERRNISSSDGDIDIPWCFGFNTDKSCKTPSQIINFFKNDIITADCDNCFAGLSGDIFVDIEFNNFKITTFQFGLKKLYLKAGLGVTVDARYDWSYAYNRVFNILNKQKIVSFKIGIVNFDIFADFPVEVDFRAYANYHERVSYGANLDINIGELYVNYYKGTWSIVKPSPTISFVPYINAETTIGGNAHFSVIPSLSIYSPSIFNVHLKFDPYCDLSVSGSTVSRNVCVNGKYEFDLVVGATILKEIIPDKTIYDSGVKILVEKCKSF